MSRSIHSFTSGRRWSVLAMVATACLAFSSGAFAQSRPLQTEDPETVGTGMVLVEAGMGYEHGEVYPASGLTGNLWRVGTFGFNFGVSPIAEIQIKGGVQDELSVTGQTPAPLSGLLTFTGTHTHDFPDAIIGAKIRLKAETASRPALAIKFSTRLPNEGNKSGLGLNTYDFNFDFLFAKTVQSVRIAGNVGFGILGSPTVAVIQNDVLNYGISVARAVQPGVEIVGEWNGRLNTRANTPPVGTESRSQMRVGSRFTRGPVRIDGALLIGVTNLDPTWGFTTGVTWVFKGFDIKQ
jgi:hypothetical protein